jgi:hypothetical protein
MASWWETPGEPVVLTEAALQGCMEKLHDRASHGTAGNPHIVHPDGGPCMECGVWFTRDEIHKGP